MAEFELQDFSGDDTGKDTGKDTGEKRKKKSNKIIDTIKKKPFLFACIVVAILGIYVWYRNSQKEQEQEQSHQNMLVADGYDALSVAGYETGLTGGGFASSGYDDFVNDMFNSFQAQIKDVQSSYDAQVDDMSMQIIKLSNKLNTQSSIIDEQADTIALQNDISVMKSNSDKWAYATSDAERKALEDANKHIAHKYGWSFNSGDGYWYDSTGSRVYSTEIQNHNSVSVPNTKPASTVQSDVQKMMSNSQAWSGASSEERKALENANKEIASKYGWTINSQSGVWYDAAGNKVYDTYGSTGSTTSSTPKSSSSSSTSSSSKSSTSSSSKSSTSSSSSNSSSSNNYVKSKTTNTGNTRLPIWITK